jgi:hypothetical protein
VQPSFQAHLAGDVTIASNRFIGLDETHPDVGPNAVTFARQDGG